jgi:DNA/RNA-binding domain of Phe-tRNA-synthetase-like protein
MKKIARIVKKADENDEVSIIGAYHNYFEALGCKKGGQTSCST